MEVESSCRVMKNWVPVSGFWSKVTKAALPLRVTPGMPEVVSPIQSVLRNSGEERRNRPWRLSSSNLSDSARVSRIDEP